MKPNNDRTNPNDRAPAEPAAPRKRFRIEKLEERLAPKKGGKGTNNCSNAASSGSTSIF